METREEISRRKRKRHLLEIEFYTHLKNKKL
jgi:hypothetical protein